MIKKILLCALTFLALPTQSYDFNGKHYIASYKKCANDRLTSIPVLLHVFEVAVKATGATILSINYHKFDRYGLTVSIILGESHASIHTYPEHNACFVDLFTCGDHCDWKRFDEVMRKYLKPDQVVAQEMIRN